MILPHKWIIQKQRNFQANHKGVLSCELRLETQMFTKIFTTPTVRKGRVNAANLRVCMCVGFSIAVLCVGVGFMWARVCYGCVWFL